MKKYLFMALAVAVSGVFVGCHEDELGGSLIEQKRNDQLFNSRKKHLLDKYNVLKTAIRVI